MSEKKEQIIDAAYLLRNFKDHRCGNITATRETSTFFIQKFEWLNWRIAKQFGCDFQNICNRSISFEISF